jgi:hypothetical protein
MEDKHSYWNNIFYEHCVNKSVKGFKERINVRNNTVCTQKKTILFRINIVCYM